MKKTKEITTFGIVFTVSYELLEVEDNVTTHAVTIFLNGIDVGALLAPRITQMILEELNKSQDFDDLLDFETGKVLCSN